MFNEYFKKPFSTEYGVKVFDKDHHMVFDWITDFTEDFKTVIVMKLNGKIGFITKNHKWATDGGTEILYDGKPAMRIRGWGYLTGIGGCKLPNSEAIKVQDSLIEYILNTLNS